MLDACYQPEFKMLMRRNKEQLIILATKAKIDVEGTTKVKLAEMLAIYQFEAACNSYRRLANADDAFDLIKER